MKELYKKLLEAKKEIKSIEKNLRNPFHKNEYADINEILVQVEPILFSKGLLLLQPMIDGMVVAQLIDVESGEKIESSLSLPPIDDPQKKGAAITYYRRYSIVGLLGLNSSDNDGNENRLNDLNPRHSSWNEAFDFVKSSNNIEESISMVKKKYSLTKDNELLLRNG